MPYVPTIWQEGVTPVGPTNLNKMERGIAAAYSSAAGVASVTGLSFSNNLAFPVLMDADNLYCAWWGTFGKVNLATGQYTALANAVGSFYMGLAKIDSDHILEVYGSGTTLYAKIYTISTNAWAAAGNIALGTSADAGALARDPATGLFYWICAQGFYRYDATAKAFTKLTGTATPYKAAIYGGALYMLFSTNTGGLWVKKCASLTDLTTQTVVNHDVAYAGQPNNLLVDDAGILYSLSHSAASGLAYNVPTTDYCALLNLVNGRLGFVGGLPTGTGGSIGNADGMRATIDPATHTVYAVLTFGSSAFCALKLSVDTGVVS